MRVQRFRSTGRRTVIGALVAIVGAAAPYAAYGDDPPSCPKDAAYTMTAGGPSFKNPSRPVCWCARCGRRWTSGPRARNSCGLPMGLRAAETATELWRRDTEFWHGDTEFFTAGAQRRRHGDSESDSKYVQSMLAARLWREVCGDFDEWRINPRLQDE